MNGATIPGDDSLSPAELERVIAVCDRFEEAWNQGHAERIEDLQGEVPEPLRPRLLRELLALESELRQTRGERPGPDGSPAPRQDRAASLETIAPDGADTHARPPITPGPSYSDLASVSLSGSGPPPATAPDPGHPTAPPAAPGAQLVALTESSLSLVGTLLVVSVQAPEDQPGLTTGDSVASTAAVLLIGPGPSAGQSVGAPNGTATSSDDDPEPAVDLEPDPAETQGESADPPLRTRSIWKRYLLGIDEPQEPQDPRVPANLHSAPGAGQPPSVVPRRADSPIPEDSTHPARFESTEAGDQVCRTPMPGDASPDAAAPPGPQGSPRAANEGPGPAPTTNAARFGSDPASPAGDSLPAGTDPEQGGRIQVSLSMLAATAVLSRCFRTLRTRSVCRVQRFRNPFRRG
jgi:hypothetical protein